MSDNITKILPVPLTEEELVNIGNELSVLQIEKEKLESEKAAIVKDYNEQIKTKESLISGLVHQINAGTKDAEVDCYWVTDNPEEGKKSLYRTDTSELLEVAEMNLLDIAEPTTEELMSAIESKESDPQIMDDSYEVVDD